ncbi:hypothetical protein [Sphingomonas jaspsi]|uniref:hypothetical protein n=1 Tax=Sphingomonas jaspsi TaxID=392409 RepID=UPI00056A866D|nr:hypothetical protein [Sphingomonas jaspsi]
MALQTCLKCGSKTRKPEAKFCDACGASLTVEQRDSTLAVAKEFISDSAKEATEQFKDAARHPAAKKIAGGAALGGAAGALLPILTVGVGAALVGGLVAYKQLTKK